MIFEYRLDAVINSAGTKPQWVESGGHMYDPVTQTMVGFSPDATARTYKIPDSVKVFTTNQEVKDRAQAIHAVNPFQKSEGGDMTTGEVDTYVDDLITAEDIGGAGNPCSIRSGQVAIDDGDSPYALRYSARTILIDANTASVTVDIPTAVGCKGLRFTLVNSTDSAANTVTLDPNASETINGATTDTGLDAQYDTMTIESDGANWLKV